MQKTQKPSIQTENTIENFRNEHLKRVQIPEHFISERDAYFFVGT